MAIPVNWTTSKPTLNTCIPSAIRSPQHRNTYFPHPLSTSFATDWLHFSVEELHPTTHVPYGHTMGLPPDTTNLSRLRPYKVLPPLNLLDDTTVTQQPKPHLPLLLLSSTISSNVPSPPCSALFISILWLPSPCITKPCHLCSLGHHISTTPHNHLHNSTPAPCQPCLHPQSLPTHPSNPSARGLDVILLDTTTSCSGVAFLFSLNGATCSRPL